MHNISFEQNSHVYFIGIGGISMSGLAEILLDAGLRVSGSDARESKIVKRLSDKGAKVYIGQNVAHIEDDIDVIVYTAAIKEDNPEYMAGVQKGIPMLSRASLLGQLMEQYQTSIAISGTHGKTSTTSMLSHILLAAKANPTISLGGQLDIISGNIRIGGREVFLTEACEYTNSFLELNPTIAVILNVEADHMDFFKDLQDIRDSFHRFVKRLPKDGCLIINADIAKKEELIGDFEGEVWTFGFDNADIMAKNIRYDALGCAEFDLVLSDTVGKQASFSVRLHAPGKHNISNAMAAMAAGIRLGISPNIVKSGIEQYRGVGRRFEYKGKLFDKITIVDDYAHHPQEIEATLTAAKNLPSNHVWCVFQPHTYTRTKAFLEEFAKALALADRVVLADIYAARESDTLGMHSGLLEELINRMYENKAIYLPGFDEIEEYLLEHLVEGDLCITMGAGDIDKIGSRLLGE